MDKRLTWEQIKELYPHQYVGLVGVETEGNESSVKSAIVKYTEADTSYDDMILMYIRGEIKLRYTTLDEDEIMGVI